MKKILWLLLFLCLLCGCQSQAADPDAVHFDECAAISMEDVESLPLLHNEAIGAVGAADFYVPTDQGLFINKLTDGSSSVAFLQFADFATGEIYPVCTKTNCTHDSYDCHAYLPQASKLHYDGEYIYYFAGIQPQLWRMNPDGTDRKILLTLPDVEGSFPLIHGAAYCGRKVYFCYWGALVNQETGEMESREFVCAGDLDTGALTTLPVQFERNPGSSTLNLLGVYGDSLVLRHSNTVSDSTFYQKNVETLLLLDVNTEEVTVVHQWEWDSLDSGTGVSFDPYAIDQGYFLFRQETDTVLTLHPDGQEAAATSGDRIFVDLAAKKAYRMAGLDDMSSHTEAIRDGWFIHQQWNADHTAIEEVALELETGETAPFRFGHLWKKPLDSHFSAGDSYLIFDFSGDSGRYGWISKEDYWAGNPDAVRYFPDWVILT